MLQEEAMKSLLFILFFLLVPQISFANQCFELSGDGQTWNLNPFRVCIEINTTGTSEFKITLSKNKKTIAIYFLNSVVAGADTSVFGIDSMNGSFLDEAITIAIGGGEAIMGRSTYYYRAHDIN